MLTYVQTGRTLYHHCAFDGNPRWTLQISAIEEIYNEFICGEEGKVIPPMEKYFNKVPNGIDNSDFLYDLTYEDIDKIFTPFEWTTDRVAQCIVTCFRFSYRSIPFYIIRQPAIILTTCLSLYWLIDDNGIKYHLMNDDHVNNTRKKLLLEIYSSGVEQGLFHPDSSITNDESWGPLVEDRCLKAIRDVGAVSVIFGPKKQHYCFWHVRFKEDRVDVKQVDGWNRENPEYVEELDFFLELLKIDPKMRKIERRYSKVYDPIQYRGGECFYIAFSAMLQYLQTPIFGGICPFDDFNMVSIRYYCVYLILTCKKYKFKLVKKNVLPPLLMGASMKLDFSANEDSN